MDNRKITLAITTWNRFDLTIKSFENVIDDDRINDVVIVDDCSNDGSDKWLRDCFGGHKKVRIYINSETIDCYKNKAMAVMLAMQEWTIIFDSDNVIDTGYLDKLYEIPGWDTNTAYMPDAALPTFIYKEFSGLTITKENVASHMGKKFFDTMLNCMNYFVNKHQYLRVFEAGINPHTADSILQNYNWLKAGNSIHVVEGMSYYHRIHEGSHYKNNVHKTGNLYAEIEEKLKQLK